MADIGTSINNIIEWLGKNPKIALGIIVVLFLLAMCG